MLLAVVAAGCGGDDEAAAAATAPAEHRCRQPRPREQLSGNAIEVDGSSTVGPLTTAAAEHFQEENSGREGDGRHLRDRRRLRALLRRRDRHLERLAPDQGGRARAASAHGDGIEYIEIQVANDALTVVVNTENDWATLPHGRAAQQDLGARARRTMTTGTRSTRASRTRSWSSSGPGTDSGTFDYFTDAINGEEGASRSDYNASEDDNVIVQAVAGEKGGLGYFGFSYYEQNQDR